MNIVTPPPTGTKTTLLDRSPKGFSTGHEDGEGSVQVKMDPAMTIDTAKVLRFTARAASASRPPRRTSRLLFRNWASVCCRSAAIRSMTARSR